MTSCQPSSLAVNIDFLPYLPASQSPAAAAGAKSLQSCLILWDPVDSSPPGSFIPGILQARVLEGVAIDFSITEP